MAGIYSVETFKPAGMFNKGGYRGSERRGGGNISMQMNKIK